MAGTFPVTGIFNSIELTSNLSKIKNIDPTNVLFEKYNFQQFTFSIKTAPLTRTQVAQIMAFLSSKGNTETFSLPLPRPFSGGSHNNRFENLDGSGSNPAAGPVANQVGYAGGTSQVLHEAAAAGASSVVFRSNFGGKLILSGTYVNSIDTANQAGLLEFKIGDFFQFDNHGKLYQFTENEDNFVASNYAGGFLSSIVNVTIPFFPVLTTAVTTSTKITTAVSPTVRLVGDVVEYESGIDNLYELEFVVEEDL